MVAVVGVDDRLARDDADLVAQIAAGDAGEPVAELYRRYGGRLYRFGLQLLQARTLARVQRAAGKSAWRRWSPRRTLSAAAAAVVAAVVTIAIILASSAPALAFTIPLHAQHGSGASGRAVAHQAVGGWSITLTVHGLRPLPTGRFYECWYAGPVNRPGHPDLITAGTFTVSSDGSATVQMWSAAAPRSFPVMQITAESPGDGGQHGQVLLSGTAQK